MSLLPNATFSAPGAPLYGTGGGGGSVGPDLTLSTLALNQGAPNTIQWRDGAGTGPVLTQQDVNTVVGANLGALSLTAEPSNVWYTLGCGEIFVAGQIGLGAETAGVISAAADGTILIQNALAVSSISVSSINGAAPGGGGSVPGNLVVSSLTLAGDGVAGGGQLLSFANDTNLYAFQVIDNTSSLVAGLEIGLIGGRNQVYIDSNAQIANSLWVSSIQQCKEAFVSSFSVSSINGSAPALTSGGVGDVAALFSTLFAANPGLSTIAY
jgi:hypothetical protein